MSTTLTAHQFPAVHSALGVDLWSLGCVMLDPEQPPVSIVETLFNLDATLYYSADPAKHWIRGPVGDGTAHVTLLYGLLEKAHEWQAHVDAVLDGWTPEPLTISHVDFFPSPYADEPYWCIIAKLKVTLEANARLRFLPHVDTFPDYSPHVTLAYIAGDEAERDRVIAALNAELAGVRLPVSSALNYGRRP